MGTFGEIAITESTYYVETPCYTDLGAQTWSAGSITPGPIWVVFSYTMPWRGSLAYTGYVQVDTPSGVLDITFMLHSVSPGPSGWWGGRSSEWAPAYFLSTASLLVYWADVAAGTVVTLWGRIDALANQAQRMLWNNGSLRATRL